MIEYPARGGARGPSCIPQDGLQPRRWPCASLESQRNSNLTSDSIKTVTGHVYPLSFSAFERSISALSKDVWVVQRSSLKLHTRLIHNLQAVRLLNSYGALYLQYHRFSENQKKKYFGISLGRDRYFRTSTSPDRL